MKDSPSIPIHLSMTISLQTMSQENLIEQFGKALLPLTRQFVQELGEQWGQVCMQRFLEEHPGYRFVHPSRRDIVSPFGRMSLPNAEIRQGRKYIGKVSQMVFGLKKKKRVLECTREMIASVITVLSFRKSAEFLKPFWGDISHQVLHKAWRSLESDIPKVLEVTNVLKRSFDVKRVLVWLDGWVIKTRQCRGAEVIRNTLRVAVAQFKMGNTIIWKATSGFLECSYQHLFKRLVPVALYQNTVVLCDGEKAIETAFTDDPLNKTITIDPTTGEILESIIVVAGIQRCLFHLGYNMLQKARSEGMSKQDAEDLSENVKKLTYFRLSTLRAIGSHWQHVLMQRISTLHWLCDELVVQKYGKLADSLRRAIPHAFTYLRFYCRDRIFIGRTTNKLENMFRHATYRLKRVGAVWSPKGAQQLLMFILANHLHYPLKLSPVKPLSFHIKAGVVKC